MSNYNNDLWSLRQQDSFFRLFILATLTSKTLFPEIILSAVAFGQIKSLLVIYLGLQSYCVCLCVFMFECVLVAPAHTGPLINCVRALTTFLFHTHTHT